MRREPRRAKRGARDALRDDRPAGEGEASWAPLLARVSRQARVPDRRSGGTLLAVRVGGLGLAAGFGLFATTAFAVLRAVVQAAAGLLHRASAGVAARSS